MAFDLALSAFGAGTSCVRFRERWLCTSCVRLSLSAIQRRQW